MPIPSYEELSVAKLGEVIAEIEALTGRTITADQWSAL
jgi:hypothetical protein